MTAPDLLVLHALRCGGWSGTGRIAATTGLTEPDVESVLLDLAVDGLVASAGGAGSRAWGLTTAGRAADAARITDELDTAAARVPVTAAFERFGELNPELLDLCTAWQLRTTDGTAAVNDHSDPAYDARVLGRFADLDARAAVVVDELAAALPRFGRYRTRLSSALERAGAGDLERVADSVDSYHTVWAELHEDLLATLGIPR